MFYRFKNNSLLTIIMGQPLRNPARCMIINKYEVIYNNNISSRVLFGSLNQIGLRVPAEDSLPILTLYIIRRRLRSF